VLTLRRGYEATVRKWISRDSMQVMTTMPAKIHLEKQLMSDVALTYIDQ